MEKVVMTITEVEFGRVEVSFSCTGDIWNWFKKYKNDTKAYELLQYVLDGTVKEFMYEAAATKFISRYSKYC